MEVDAGGASLQLEEHGSCGCRAVDSARIVSASVRDGVLGWLAGRTVHTYGRPLYVSSPARWSLWMWLKKHASGGFSVRPRKKSTGRKRDRGQLGVHRVGRILVHQGRSCLVSQEIP